MKCMSYCPIIFDILGLLGIADEATGTAFFTPFVPSGFAAAGPPMPKPIGRPSRAR